jgi:hypothetical protein
MATITITGSEVREGMWLASGHYVEQAWQYQDTGHYGVTLGDDTTCTFAPDEPVEILK